MLIVAGAELGPMKYPNASPIAQKGRDPATSTLIRRNISSGAIVTLPKLIPSSIRIETTTALKIMLMTTLPMKYAAGGMGLARFTCSHPKPRSAARAAAVPNSEVPMTPKAPYVAFGVMGTSLFGTAAALAAERGLGWLQVKRASPMPPAAYFIGKVVMSMIFSAVVVSILMLLGISFGKVTMAPLEMLRLISVLVAGSLPFCAMGLALGYFIGPNSAPATINMIYLPISFCSGLWVPIMFLPRLMRQAAHLLPPYHLAQVALRIVEGGDETPGWQHWQFLIAFTLVCLGIAYYGFRRDEGKMYG